MTAHIPQKISTANAKEINFSRGKKAQSYAAFICDSTTQEALAEANEHFNIDPKSVHLGGIAQAVRTVSETNASKILIVDLSESSEPKKDIEDLSEVCEQGTIVIALGNINDIQFYRSLSQVGVFDYLQKPINKSDYISVINSAIETIESANTKPTTKPSTAQKSLGIVGVRGGLGASTIAINMGWLLAHKQKLPTTLIDLDLQFGTSALAFDLEPGRGLRDALEHPSRIDPLFIERAVVQQSDKLSILGTESPLSEKPLSKLDSANILTKAVKNKGQHIILDIPRQMITHEPKLVEALDTIILVSNLTLAATRDTIRFIEHFKKIAPALSVKIVLNKVEKGDENEIKIDDFESSVGQKVSWKIPHDNKTFRAAIHEAKSLFEINAKAVCSVEIASMVSDVFSHKMQAQKKVGFFQRLFSGDES